MQNRIKWIDVMKGICIFFVMLSHSYPPDWYRRFFTPFFLTMFFFASGYTYHERDGFDSFLRKKIKDLWIPLFGLGGIRVLVLWALGREKLPLLVEGLFLQINCVYDELWFISCLFVVSLLFYGVLRIACRNTGEISLVKLILPTFVIFGTGLGIIYGLQYRCVWEFELACVMLPFMVLGYLVKSKGWSCPKLWAMASAIAYILLVVLVDNKVDIHEESFGNVPVFLLASLLVMAPLIKLSKALERTVLSKALIFMGQNTLFYFAFSGFVRELLYRVFPGVADINPYIASLLCALAMTLVMHYPIVLANKYLPFVGKNYKSGRSERPYESPK